MRRAEGGLTLFEVLAAVALLGILFTVLARVASQGVRAEGDSYRRQMASLIIDNQLGDLERTIAEGSTPPLGHTENELAFYRLETDVESFVPPAELMDRTVPGADGVPSVLGGSTAGSEGLIRRITLRLSWPDAGDTKSVERTTYDFDRAAALVLVSRFQATRQGPATGEAPEPTEDQPPSEGR